MSLTDQLARPRESSSFAELMRSCFAPLRRSGLDVSALSVELSGYRKLLQDAWSKETRHESFSRLAVDAPESGGQCGVSSAWLLEELVRQEVRNVTYCYGDIFSADVAGQIELERHCWIEIGRPRSRRRLVIDLTGDQSEILRGYDVVYGKHAELRKSRRVNYRTHTRMTLTELGQDPVQKRLVTLKANLEAKG